MTVLEFDFRQLVKRQRALIASLPSDTSEGTSRQDKEAEDLIREHQQLLYRLVAEQGSINREVYFEAYKNDHGLGLFRLARAMKMVGY